MDISNNKAGSVSEIIELIKSQFQFLEDENNIQNLWFRAENVNVNTSLIPNAYRNYGRVEETDYAYVYEQAKEIEGNLKAEFSRNSKMFLSQNGIVDNEWNNYFLMQHYGLNTRLLDWTESALVAVFFAIKEESKREDSKIWILNPYRLNDSTYKSIKGFENISGICFPQSTEKRSLIEAKGELNIDELCRKYLKMDFDSDEKSYPLAIYPYLFDERMKVQKACFTIFGNEVNGLLNKSEKDNFLKSILIDGNKKQEIKEELRWLGVSEESVYPGLGSNCKDIQEKYKMNVLEKI